MGKASTGKNSVYSLIKSISNVLFPLISFPYISRVLEPTNIGKYNYSFSIVSYFALIASLGIMTYAVRECAKNRDNRQQLGTVASQIFSINVMTTVIAYLSLFVAILCIKKLQSYTLLIIIQSSSIMFTTLGTDWLNIAMEDFKYVTYRTVGFQILSLVLMFAFVRSADDYIKYAVIVVISSSGANLLNVFYRRKFCKITYTQRMNLKKHFKPILALFSMIIAQQVFTVSDVTMIGYFKGDYEVGLYSTATKVYNVINQIIASITWVVMPQLSQYFSEDDYNRADEVLEYAYQFLITLGIPCVLGVLFYSKQVVLLVGGEAYIGAANTMKILAVTLGFAIIACYLLNINILASGNDRVAVWACVVPALFNLVANYLFIPRFGIEAAAWTTVFSQIVIILICIPFVPKGYHNRDIIARNKMPFIAGIVVAIFITIENRLIDSLWIELVIAIVIGAMIYIGILWIKKYEFLMKVIGKK